MSQRITKGDEVLIISGKDKGKRGTVLRVEPKKDRVVVEGVNLATRHIGHRHGTTQTGIIHGEAALPMCKVMLVDTESGVIGRAKFEFLADGTKVRVIKGGKRS